jgi:selenide,water dikinase
VQTVDFFTPVVDDPYDFGRIAAANAISDVYAMGGTPLFALALVAFPVEKLGLEVLAQILRGGQDKAHEAGIHIVGGHSVDDPEPKYGLCVTGLVDPRRVLRNQGARAGDALLLTKPLGIGIATTAIKRGLASAELVRRITEQMAELNRRASEVLREPAFQVHALTDVTGFGLLGHLRSMLAASGVGARLRAAAVPVLPEARPLAEKGAIPGGTRANLRFVLENGVRFAPELDEVAQLVLADAQTNGGLLASLPREKAEECAAALRAAGCPATAVIGEVVEGRGIDVDR